MQTAQHVELGDGETLFVAYFADVMFGAVDQPDGEGSQIQVER
jgi:hypothetical protein